MRRKHLLAFIGLLCTLALTLSVALAEEDGLFLPEDLGAVETQADGLTIEDSTLIDGLGGRGHPVRAGSTGPWRAPVR